ncbi:hypothetical protein I5515_11540 [Acinetobacter calcoaceticus]|uniref:hypothetical protein n=1 Tax=Acinetobacter calcoaceticus TaxID=471 RepID=UPI0018FF24E4|nr:hypothetical protein [Acinetobacter calcoaceticus]MBJ9722435.1 hypothetical protein [Acinetobacter calcoaceticus]
MTHTFKKILLCLFLYSGAVNAQVNAIPLNQLSKLPDSCQKDEAAENNKLVIQASQVKIQSYSCFKPNADDALGYNVFAIHLDKNKTYYFKSQTRDISSIAGQNIHKIDSETFAIDNYQERGGNFIIFWIADWSNIYTQDISYYTDDETSIDSFTKDKQIYLQKKKYLDNTKTTKVGSPLIIMKDKQKGLIINKSKAQNF